MGDNKEKYSKFIDSIKIDEIFLKNIDLTRSLIILEEKGDLKFEIENVSSNLRNNNEIFYEVKIKLIGYKDENEEQENFHINLSYGLNYILTDEIEIDDEILERYERNAVFNVWPYLRNTVSDLSHKMELNLPPIPLFKF